MPAAGLQRIEGVNLVLRLVEPDDADYIFSLRTNPLYNVHLSEVRGTSHDQRIWIENYKAREALGAEYYYVIERKDGVRCGVVRLYEISGRNFTWGSWILDYNKPPKAALESALLLYMAAFERLNLSEAHFDVRADNHRTLAFHHRFRATKTHADHENVYFVYPRSQFEVDRDEHWQAVNGVSER